MKNIERDNHMNENLLHQMFTIQFKDEREQEWSDGARFNKLEKAQKQVKEYLHLNGFKYQLRIVCDERKVIEYNNHH